MYKYNLNIDGPQGNAFYLLSLAKQIIKDNKLDLDFNEISEEMKAGDYDNLVNVFYNHFGEYIND